MRVITGDAKGHQLKAPPGLSTRPTTDLVRGAIFSILQSMKGEISRVLDLYAGSGAMGIEALSEGSDWCDFVDQNTKCCAVIKQNLTATGLTERARVQHCSARSFISHSQDEYDLILIDPPYSNTSTPQMLEDITNSELVGRNTTIVIQYSRHMLLQPSYNRFDAIKTRRYGGTCVSFYQVRNAEW
ncbi:MAG: 16S rRNA (guanine(966)-N(2))-methyltransferase RsmD [Dehalococcoidia bacterium]|nr:16S rRNA (guanine(966)-N(2))-methyltransferase RsmD [Dehalococcoidia bacterium]